MSKTAGELLEQFRKLAANDQRELFDLLLRELAVVPPNTPPHARRSLAEVAGKYRPTPNPQAASHDALLAEAIAASKTGSLAA